MALVSAQRSRREPEVSFCTLHARQLYTVPRLPVLRSPKLRQLQTTRCAAMQERGPTFLDGAGDSPRLPAALHCLSLSLSLAHPGSRNHRFSNWWGTGRVLFAFCQVFPGWIPAKVKFFQHEFWVSQMKILIFPDRDRDGTGGQRQLDLISQNFRSSLYYTLLQPLSFTK